ncbi:MAG: electron transport complex subunit RsxC [Lachnospiraceae bacterium]|nr:electron transport complex subunit RsxC [Lachnospiraceae bacterium]
MGTFRGGARPFDGKALTMQKPIKEVRPKGNLVYPLLQHQGTAATPIVAVGDYVLTGQMIAQASGPVSAPVHASVSGTVRAIEEHLTADGSIRESIIVENDGHYDEIGFPQTKPLQEMSIQEKITAIHNAGVVGMSGSGMPAALKYTPREPEKIEYIIANCIECEPYLTNDYRRMIEEPELIVSGLHVVLSLFPRARGIIAIGDDKPEAAKRIRSLVKKDPRVSVRELEAKYPLGNDRMLVYACTERAVRASMLPSDAGCIVSNCDTLVAVYHAVAEGRPSLERIVTISGDAVREPGNYRVRIGTSYKELVEDAGGIVGEPARILSGGSMTGVAVTDYDFPTTKTASALVFLSEKAVAEEVPSACIRCGRCADRCPLGLLPLYLADAAAAEDQARFRALYGMECMNCGVCSYVCPARRELSREIVRMQELENPGERV